MLQKVSVPRKKLSEYKGIIKDSFYKKILNLSEELRGKRVLNINATRFGGGVAELLYSLVPLMRDVGIDAEWRTIAADERLFKITKSFHNAFQGERYNITKSVERTYKRFNAYNAHLLEGDWDIIIIHDPQPAAIPYYAVKDGTKFIWRCHIDTSHPNKKMWELFKPFLEEYDATIFTMPEFVPKDLPVKKKFFIHPAIDAFSSKNREMPEKTMDRILETFGVDKGRPIITQISRFDVWKDPLGVVKAYKIAKKVIPGLQLVLAGSLSDDDPEGWLIYKEIEKYTSKDKDIHVYTNLSGFADLEVNTFQRKSDIIIQKSTREGFGLTVSEAMLKETPVIGGNVGGIKLQIENGVTGFLVKSSEECAEKIIYLLNNKGILSRMGKKAKEVAVNNFLMPYLLYDELMVFKKLLPKSHINRF